MPTINSGIYTETQTFNLREIDIDNVRREVKAMLIDGEKIISAFKTIRDQVVFTDKRILVINVQGLTGNRVSYFSYPYSRIQYYGIQTAGVLDVDCEMILTFSNGAVLQFEFRARVNIRKIATAISAYIL